MFTEMSLFKMSSSESNYGLSCISDNGSEYKYLLGIYRDFETEKVETAASKHDVDDLSDDPAYTDDPLTDQQSLKEYEQQHAEERSD